MKLLFNSAGPTICFLWVDGPWQEKKFSFLTCKPYELGAKRCMCVYHMYCPICLSQESQVWEVWNPKVEWVCSAAETVTKRVWRTQERKPTVHLSTGGTAANVLFIPAGQFMARVLSQALASMYKTELQLNKLQIWPQGTHLLFASFPCYSVC